MGTHLFGSPSKLVYSFSVEYVIGESKLRIHNFSVCFEYKWL